MGAGIPADRTCAYDSYLPAHVFLPALLLAEASASARLITTVEPRRALKYVFGPFVQFQLAIYSSNAWFIIAISGV